jgi:hypothetical protein
MHPDLLEDAPAHHRHHAAAAGLATVVGAVPGLLREAAGSRGFGRERTRRLVLEPLERGAEAIAQGGEPDRGFGLQVLDHGGVDGRNRLIRHACAPHR